MIIIDFFRSLDLQNITMMIYRMSKIVLIMNNQKIQKLRKIVLSMKGLGS